MRTLNKKTSLILIGVVFLGSLCINGLDIFANYFTLSEYGSPLLLWFSFLIAIIPMLIALCLFPLSFLGILFKRARKISLLILISGIIYVLVGFTCFYIGGRVYMYGFKKIAIHSRPLITAINSYDLKYGHPPEKLQDLVPEFLNKVPTTGIGENPEYKYRVLSRDSSVIDRWRLDVTTPFRGIGWDEFYYYPSHNYPNIDSSGRYEKVEDWVYYHE